MFADQYQSRAFSVFNPNEYPPASKSDVYNSAFSLARVWAFAEIVRNEIQASESRGFDDALWQLISARHLPHDMVALFPSQPTITAFEGFAVASKTLLDVLARLAATRSPSIPKGFNKSGDVVGGRFLRGLKSSSIQQVPGRDVLLQVIEDHKRSWIDDLIGVRDAIAHGGTSGRIVGFALPLYPGMEISRLRTAPPQPPAFMKDDGTVIELRQFVETATSGSTVLAESFRDALYPEAERQARLAGQDA